MFEDSRSPPAPNAILYLPAMRHFLRFCLVLLLIVSAEHLDAQCLSGDCENGTGTAVHKEGWTYTGPFMNGLYEGDGLVLRDDSMVAFAGFFEAGDLPNGRYVVGEGADLFIYDGDLVD